MCNYEKKVIKRMHEGKYKIKFPLLILFRPRLFLYTGKKSGKLKGRFSMLRFQKKLSLVKEKQDELLLQMKVDFFIIDIVLRFDEKGVIKGFLDTPIGNFHFSGIRVEV
jgi:hypothetical protein